MHVSAIDVAITKVSAVIAKDAATSVQLELMSLSSVSWSAADRAAIMGVIHNPTSSSLKDIGRVNRMIGDRTAAAVLVAVREAGLLPSTIDLIASHGPLFLSHFAACACVCPTVCDREACCHRFALFRRLGASPFVLFLSLKCN